MPDSSYASLSKGSRKDVSLFRLVNRGSGIKIEGALVGYGLQLQRLNLGFSLL
ncbi:hypothetical protein M595_3190 [Lyngbya aestuarii BL J]|uniref:Uncharacterized protein n=1 Tax=Lyngbya aestuarii BL J TaxID=1348334 RepID=U7QIJ9_9CYAN|nr:hypothetical protein M595_3190 [Lyngbya aestuarii BL J]